MPGKFETYQDSKGKFRFRLKTGQEQVVATGEAYETRAAAGEACERTRRAAEGATIEIVDDVPRA